MNTCETEQALQPINKHEHSVAKWQDEYSEHLSQRTPKETGILKYYKQNDYFLAGNTTGDTSASKAQDFEKRQNPDKNLPPKQGTFTGVILPVMQNILGVLLFIRVPAITGEAGIRDSFLLVLICCCTTFLTVLSLSAIATNGRISTGGTYYILSRSLGAPIGTAVGFCFYLGTTFGGAMYILGAVESFIISTKVELADSFQLSMRVYGTILLILIVFVNIVGLKYVAKTGIIFLSVVLLGITGMYIGILTQSARDAPELPDIEDEYKENDGITGISGKYWEDNWKPEYVDNGFFILLSIYFPSVTGIMAGSNRSGDLLDASKSIPKGTLTAQLITSFIYLSFPVLFGVVSDRGTLQTEEYIIAAECTWPTKYLTTVAIILSSTGAGLQCIAGAPRILLAIADDDNLPCFRIFKNKINRVILLTGVICFGAVMIGDINVITPIITMFFLLCYGFVNLCCIFLDTVAQPSWRPTWKFYHRFFSFLGLSSCVFLMIAISWWSFLIVIAMSCILFAIVFYNKKDNSHYGDSIDAVKLASAKNSLLGMVKSSKHVKNWIPIVLVIGDQSEDKDGNTKLESEGALFFLNTIKKDISFIVYGSVIDGHYTISDKQRVEQAQQKISKWFADEKMQVITKVVQSERKKEIDIPANASQKEKEYLKNLDLKQTQQGLLFLMQGAGIGGLEPNTVMLEFPEKFKQDPIKAERFVQFISYGVRFGKAVMTTINDSRFAPQKEVVGDKQGKRVQQEKYKGKNIDIWTFSYENGLLNLMTYFLTRSPTWKDCKIRFFVTTLLKSDQDRDGEVKRIKEKVSEFLYRYRIYTKNMEIDVELIEIDQWQQMEGYMLTEGKQQQLLNNPELKDAPVDPTSNYGMDLNGQQQEKKPVSTTGNNLAAPVQKPERALSVMSQNQVSQLNNRILSKSKDSELIIMNLPEPVNQKTMDYLEYIRNMTQGLKKVLMIRNSTQECITEFT